MPANIGVTVVSGSSTLSNQSYPIEITGRNTVFWSNAGKDTSTLIATMVTPHDKNGLVDALLRSAANRFPGGMMPGYQASNWPAAAYTIAPGQSQTEYFYLLAGESPSVYINPSTNVLSQTVTRHRPMTEREITYYQAKAIFDELRTRGLTYINLTGGTSYFYSTQNVLYPSESISNLSANCIDGALLFASAFEALGMDPVLVISHTAGHAMVSVRV